MKDNRIALVTGATGGIGGAIVKALVKNNIKVVVTGRNQEKLDKLINELGHENVVYAQTFDINDYEAMKNFVKNYEAKGIVIDILVNNAGLALGLAPFQDYDISQAITMIDTNVKSLTLMSYLVLQQMKETNEGHIINIGSTAGQFAYPNGSVYCATKAAVKMLSDGMRGDLIKTDIKVTTIQPGLVETDFSYVRFSNDRQRADEVYSGIEALQAEDIANALMYVISQPKRVQIQDLSILANAQGNGFTNFKK